MERLLPAYPLFIKDPYFSFYSNGEVLNESKTIFWTGVEKQLLGILKVDNKTYSFLGISDLEKLEQIDLKVSSFKTSYTFKKDDFTLYVDFVSPLLLNDLKLLSCPVCYLDYHFESKNKHQIELALILNQNWCYNEESFEKTVRGGIVKLDNYNTSWFGLKRQLFLSQCADATLADWGYYYLASKNAYFCDEEALNNYYKGEFTFKNEGNNKYIIASSNNLNDTIYIAHDDCVAIMYFNEILKTYYFEDDKNIFDALNYMYKNHDSINQKLDDFDKNLFKQCQSISKNYYNICVASLRQAIGAHKLVKNKDNELLFLSKECNSNGCIGTVDISYPSIPLFLLYNPTLVKGMLTPIFKFARMPIWKYDFAPHDVGTYPLCIGQVYGLNNKNDEIYSNYASKDNLETYPNIFTFPSSFDAYDFNMQMPVEESSNLIIMAYAIIKYGNELEYVKNNFDLLTKWCKYLVDFGKIPANQLCTDDFAGHVNKNINLSIKATVGIRAYAEICKLLNDNENYKLHYDISCEFASFIESVANEKGYLPLSYDVDDTRYSLKYNLAMDKLFDFKIFSDSLYEKEFKIYLENINEYGIALDPRKDYSKSDWQMWIAAIANDTLKEKLINTLDHFLKNSPDRYPFSDWYESLTGINHMFRNRTVQGGNFLPLLIKNK